MWLFSNKYAISLPRANKLQKLVQPKNLTSAKGKHKSYFCTNGGKQCPECVTCVVELLHSGQNLPLELLRGVEDVVLKLLLVLLQHDVTVNQHLLEPHPLAIQHLTHFLHLWVNQVIKFGL